jgi:hypothetical protein
MAFRFEPEALGFRSTSLYRCLYFCSPFVDGSYLGLSLETHLPNPGSLLRVQDHLALLFHTGVLGLRLANHRQSSGQIVAGRGNNTTYTVA